MKYLIYVMHTKERIERTEQIEELNNIGDSLDYFVKKEEKYVAASGTTQSKQ